MTDGLSHRHVVNTRAQHQAAALDDLLRARGAVPVSYPCIAIVPADDDQDFDQALADLVQGHYQWLTLTSTNTVVAVEQRLHALGLKLPHGVFRSAAIGPATREAARHHLNVATLTLPGKYVAESLAESLPVQPGERVLVPESEIARPALADILRSRGAEVTVVTAYRTVCGSGGADVPRLIAGHRVDAITFTSTSTVHNFVERIGHEGGDFEATRELCAACIGPITADAAREAGFNHVVVPSEYTLDKMTDAMDDFFRHRLVTGEDRS